jgi:hypothetical protein
MPFLVSLTKFLLFAAADVGQIRLKLRDGVDWFGDGAA